MDSESLHAVAVNPVPDSAAGLHWVIRRLNPAGAVPSRADEVAVLETDGPAHLSCEGARHMAALLLAYAEGW